MLLLGRRPVTTRDVLLARALSVAARATAEGAPVGRLPAVDRVVGLLARQLLVRGLMVAKGLVLPGLTHILALVGALLAKGARLLRTLCLLALRWSHR